MVDWEDAGGTATHPKEWHICTGEGVSHGNRHHTIQVHIENSRIGPGVFHRINGGCDRGKWSDEAIAVVAQRRGEIHCKERIIFDDHDAHSAEQRHRGGSVG